MKKLLKIMGEKLRSGEDLMLVTVVASSGATPRGAGARMLVGREGRIYGTIGGGAVEYRSEHIAAEQLAKRASLEHDFTLTKDDVQNLGMICGGDVKVFFHYIPAGDANAAAVSDEAAGRFERGESFWLVTDLKDGGRLSAADKSSAPAWLLPHLSGHPQRVQVDGHDVFVEQLNASGRVYIFGGGHVAQALEPVLTNIGFRCVIMDDRPDFTRRELFPTAEEIKLIDFSNIAASVSITGEDYVCVMTRGHAFDTVVQSQILPLRPYYVGVIGSRAKAAGVRRQLIENYGVSEADCDLVTTPIGLDIGAETPAEIAISIAAQLIAVRAGRSAK